MKLFKNIATILITVSIVLGSEYYCYYRGAKDGFKKYYDHYEADNIKYNKDLADIRKKIKRYRVDLDSALIKQRKFFKTHQSCKPNQHKRKPVYPEKKKNALSNYSAVTNFITKN